MFIVRINNEITGVRFMALEGKPTDDELEVYIEFELTRLAREPAVDSLMVLSITHAFSPSQRKRMREAELEMAARTTAKQLGLAMVVPNSLIRGAFTAYYWIAPPAYPITAVATAVEAYPFVAQKLRGAAMPVPSQERFERLATAEWTPRVAVSGEGLVPMDSLAAARAS